MKPKRARVALENPLTVSTLIDFPIGFSYDKRNISDEDLILKSFSDQKKLKLVAECIEIRQGSLILDPKLALNSGIPPWDLSYFQKNLDIVNEFISSELIQLNSDLRLTGNPPFMSASTIIDSRGLVMTYEPTMFGHRFCFNDLLTRKIVDLLNINAGVSALIGVLAAEGIITAIGAPVAFVASALLWIGSGVISFMNNGKGVCITIPYFPGPPLVVPR